MNSTPPQPVERILLLRLSALGDCAAAIPVLLALRERFPHAHIAWAIQDNNLPLIRNIEELDEAIIFPRARWRQARTMTKLREGRRLIRHLRKRRFDVAVDVQSNSKSALLAWLSGAPVRIGHGSEEAREVSASFNNRLIPPPPSEPHIIRRNLNLLSALGIDQPEVRFSLPKDAAAHKQMQRWLAHGGLQAQQYVLLTPFCGRPEKEWPRAHFSELAHRLASAGVPVVIQRSPGREAECDEIVREAQHEKITASPPTNIPQLVELIRMAGLVFGGDTGPLQIAGALGTPSICLFGPTDPNRLRPWSACEVMSLEIDPITAAKTILTQYHQ